jgi:hypothetical protein
MSVTVSREVLESDLKVPSYAKKTPDTPTSTFASFSLSLAHYTLLTHAP